MTPRMPNTSVSPLATRNSTSPYCTPFRSWTARLTRSIQNSAVIPGLAKREPGTHKHRCGRSRSTGATCVYGFRVRCCAPPRNDSALSRHAAAAGRIGEAFVRDRDVLVTAVAHLAEIDVLHDVVRLREADRPARRVDLRAFHRNDHLVARAGVAADRREPDVEKSRRVVALHGIDVAVEAGLLLERLEEGLVRRVVEVVGVVQRGLDAVRRLALRLDRAVGEEAGAVERDLVLESRRRVVLDELHGAAAGEEREHRVGAQRADAGDERLELDLRERQVELLDDLPT